MRLLVIEHETDSGSALLGKRAEEVGFTLDVRVPKDLALPPTAVGFDAILSLGASPSVNDPDAGPWLNPHLCLLRDANERGVPIFGVCFGAQALAVALGGSVTRSSTPEVGWYTVESSSPELIENGPWLQWHVDAITPPPSAVVVATSATCVQAYTVGRHLGVQFHPEVTIDEVTSWAAGDPGGPPSAGTDAETILARFGVEFPAAVNRASRLFDRFLRHAGLLPPAGHPQ